MNLINIHEINNGLPCLMFDLIIKIALEQTLNWRFHCNFNEIKSDRLT
jgi:hypothetical protein